MNDIQITKLLPSHARDVADLHISGIHTGFISSLGIKFVTALYKAIAESKSAFGFVVLKNDRVVGFVAFTTNVNDLYKSVIFHSGVKLAIGLAFSKFSFALLKKIYETLFYPRRLKKLNLPSAELISISVSSEVRSLNLGTELTYKGLAECKNRNLEKIKVLVGAKNQPANRLYLKCGFEFLTQINNHGVLSNIYTAQVVSQRTKTSQTEDIFARPLSTAATDMPPAFVTYGWCRSSYTAVQSLGKRGIDVHVGDASPFAMSRFSRYCRSFTKLPDFFVEPEKYFEEICKALRKTGAKILLPCHEDVGIFSKHINDLPEGINVAVPQSRDYCLAEDKFDVLNLANEAGCPVPRTTEISSLSQLKELSKSSSLPVVIKARTGNSAKGVRVARSKDEFVNMFRGLVQTFNLPPERWPMVQEFLPGEAAGVCLLYDHGKCVASFTEEYLRCKEPGKFGTSTLRKTYKNEKLISRAISVMDKLNWHGVAHLDFVADSEGNFKLIEINPRLWGALLLSVFSGVDFPYLWYLTALGRKITDEYIAEVREIKCRWVIGDCLAFFELVRHGRFLEAVKIFRPYSKCYHDDFSIKDPLPFVFEILDYLAKFVKSGFSTNPVVGNMIR